MENEQKSTEQKVWEKGKIVGNKPDEWRQDYAGAWINFKQRGEGDYGWDIDHQKPVSKEGTDNIANLVPLHWKNNRTKGDNYPEWETIVSSDGDKNIDCRKSWKAN